MQPKKTPHHFCGLCKHQTEYWRRRELGEMTSIMRFLMQIFQYLSLDGPCNAITDCNQRCYYDQSSKHNHKLVLHHFLKTTKPPIIVSSARQTKISVSLRMVKKMSLFILCSLSSIWQPVFLTAQILIKHSKRVIEPEAGTRPCVY